MTLTAMPLGDYKSIYFAPWLCLCVTTRPIRKIPHDNVASYCLAMPQIDLRVSGSGGVSVSSLSQTIICAICLDLG